MGTSKLFIHIGTHKTGSSSIQNAIRKERKKLKKEGIANIGRPSFFYEIGRAESLNDRYIDKSSEELSARMKREKLLKRNTFIISEEEFSGNVLNGYQNSRYVAKTLKKITDQFDVEVFIVIYLRRQDEFVESQYTQLIHEGGSLPFKNYVQNIEHNWFNWEVLLDNYATFFGKENIIVKCYSKNILKTKDSLVQSFGEIIGSNTLKEYQKTVFSNKGYSRDALEIARMINPHLDSSKKKKLRYLFQRVSTKKPFERYDYFDFDQRVEFLERYQNSNNTVAENYFDNQDFFKNPEKSSKNNYYNGLSNESLIIHLTSMILEMESLLKKEHKFVSKKKIAQSLSKITSYFPWLKEYVKLIFGKYY